MLLKVKQQLTIMPKRKKKLKSQKKNHFPLSVLLFILLILQVTCVVSIGGVLLCVGCYILLEIVLLLRFFQRSSSSHVSFIVLLPYIQLSNLRNIIFVT